jgi:hypothetical protein
MLVETYPLTAVQEPPEPPPPPPPPLEQFVLAAQTLPPFVRDAQQEVEHCALLVQFCRQLFVPPTLTHVWPLPQDGEQPLGEVPVPPEPPPPVEPPRRPHPSVQSAPPHVETPFASIAQLPLIQPLQGPT